jgi:hypothetical protein
MDCTPYTSNLQAQGVGFVARYYSNLAQTRNPAKVLTPREAHDLSQAGFSLVVVWEFLATPGYFTSRQGQADGEYAYRYAVEMIRQPETSAIYFAVDFDATQAQFVQCALPYFEGVAQSFANVGGNQPIYSVGVYGSGAVCAALKQAGLAHYTWLSQSKGWQGSQNYQDWDIQQGPLVSHPPFQFDEDVAKDDFGAFRLSFESNADLFATNLSTDSVTGVAEKRIATTRTKSRSGKARGGLSK